MENLALDSLKITNFRPFRDLQIEKLGRVNLIVGKNSLGKSSLLEAVYLYANEGSIRKIEEILRIRNETNFARRFSKKEEIEKTDSAFKYLFYGRANLGTLPPSIRISSLYNSSKQLSLAVSWFEERNDAQGNRKLYPLNLDAVANVSNPRLILDIKFNSNPERFIYLGEKRGFQNGFLFDIPNLTNIFISTGGLSEDDLGELWNAITLTEHEDDVHKAMQIILPNLERVGAITEGEPDFSHFIIVKLHNYDERIPLGSLGDGLHRVFGIALALVNCKDGILLVDEIENGLHYTIQLGLWRVIFKLAQKLNVQVFATTHSWDCIEAFQKAATEDEQSEGLLIRLENKDGDIIPTLFDEEDLAVVTKEQIEVR